jgi:hypothetical protein
VDVIHVPRKIALVTDSVFPKPPLPECKLAIPVPADRYPRNEQASAEVSFDATPAPGENSHPLPARSGSHAGDREGSRSRRAQTAALGCCAKRCAQRVHMIDQGGRAAVRERDRKEMGSAVDAVAPISHHGDMIPPTPQTRRASDCGPRSCGLRAPRCPAYRLRSCGLRWPTSYPTGDRERPAGEPQPAVRQYHRRVYH